MLREDQQSAIDNVRAELLAGRNRIMLQGPTGTGKTKIAAAITRRALDKDKRIIFTVPRLSLIDQTVKAFWDEGIEDVGVIQAQHEQTNWSKPVQVCSVATLQRRGPPKADLVIPDEAHIWFSFYGKWLLDPQWSKVPFIGLSASPWTRGLGRYYQSLVISMTTEAAIEKGILCPFRVFAPSHPDLTGVRTLAGDYHQGDLSGAVDKAPLIADIVQTWMLRAFGKRTIVFAVDRAHAEKIKQQFVGHGVTAEYMDAYTSMLEREAIKRRFHAGETKVVCNCDVLTVGVDWKVDCLVLAAPTKSEIRHVQRVGRSLRIDPENPSKVALILDHSDTHLRLGFVTDINHAALDQGLPRASLKSDRVPLPKECPKCAFLKPPRTAKCPACGFIAEHHSKIECTDGELKEIKRGKKGAKAEPTIFEKREWYGGLQFIAMERGYKPGWVGNQYREKFGVWPRDMAEVLPTEPSPRIRSWVKSRQIRYAKGRQKATAAHHPVPA